MLPKSLRLSRKDLLLVKSQGKKLSSPHFSAIILPHSPGRTAIVTSTKLSKSAVIRNRLRRTIYSCLPQLSYDLIIFPKGSMLKLSSDQTRSALDSFISTLH
ncbi:MAG: ribonuclease P protein component [Patescibacteria group bacterium]